MGETARERMVRITTELLLEGKAPQAITVKEIIERAGVGMGMVNYHFQTKEHLVDLAIERFMLFVVPSVKDMLLAHKELPPKEQLFLVVSEVADCITKSPGDSIARQAFLQNLMQGVKGDTTALAAEVLYEPMRRALPHCSEQEVWVRLQMLVFTLEMALLRAPIMKEVNRLDFYNQSDRNDFLKQVTNILLS